jgi:hypothetical protein
VGGGIQLGPLGTAATNRPIVPVPGDYDDGEVGGTIGKGNRSTLRKPAPMPLCPQQNPHAARSRTRAAAVGSQRLTAWATARPKTLVSIHACVNWEIRHRIIRRVLSVSLIIITHIGTPIYHCLIYAVLLATSKFKLRLQSHTRFVLYLPPPAPLFTFRRVDFSISKKFLPPKKTISSMPLVHNH